MNNNHLWWAFLAFIALPTVYFTWVCVHSLQDYYAHTDMAQPIHIDWNYEQIGRGGTYAPVAHYTFQAQGKVIAGDTALSEPLFRDAWVADDVLNRLRSRSWKVWYQTSHPEHSTLDRRFPWKECFTAVALLGLFFYFLVLGQYMRKKLQQND